MFIAQQRAPYVQPTIDAYFIQHDEASAYEPTMHFSGPCPHGRNSETGSDDGSHWGPDAYGYTDFDEYHLALFGA